jgi:endonuclease YncB( thermonuclease family)
MRRRGVLKGIGAGAGAVTTGIGGLSAFGAPARAQTQSIPPLYFDSTTALLNGSGNPLTDDALVSVYAHDSATAVDSDGNEDVTSYGSDPIALVATDDDVVAIGCPFLTDDTDFSFGNEEFMLNVWDHVFGGEGTVLWDEGHEQYYHLGRFETFEAYAETQGYTVESTTDMATDLEGVAGIVITTPTAALSDAELSALSDFVANGGGVILHSQSDYRDFDATANSNAILSELGANIRFNDAQIMDSEHGPGPEYIITTDQFTSSLPYFGDRQGISSGPRFDIGSTYEATIDAIDDGDTFRVTVEDGNEEVRVLGVDTPESPENAEFEMPHEWPGLGDESSGSELDEDYPTLASWAEESTAFAEDELAGETVTLSFDENEGLTDPFGRLLAYVEYDADGSGSRDTLFANRLLDQGLARTFHSGTSRHDAFLQNELSARESGTGLWAESNLTESSEYRNGAVEEVFVPNAARITSEASDSLPDARVLVRAAESASAPGSPLVAVDSDAGVAMTGGLMVNDGYEPGSDFEGDVTGYDNFTLLTNILTALSDREGDVLVAGGKGQFDAAGSLTAEATSFYQRHLEGADVGLEGINDLTSGLLDGASAVIITAPPNVFQSAELQALTQFRDDGGAVILMGSAAASTTAVQNLNTIAISLGTDLRVDSETVTDPDSNVVGDELLLVSDRFSEAADVYDAWEPDGPSLGGGTTAGPDTTTGEMDSTTEPTTTSGSGGPGMGVVTGIVSIAGGAAALLRSDRFGEE